MFLETRERRKYYRHPISAPLRLSAASKDLKEVRTETSEVSLGGLSFLWRSKLSRGHLVNLAIPIQDKCFEVKGRVAYSVEDRKTGKYRIGVHFTDSPSAFRAKLAEEALEILRYRKEMSRTLGKEVTEEEAAKKWVQEFAKDFPDFS